MHREDGLAFLVKKGRLIIQDYKEIMFHDCGDRVAQLLLIALDPRADSNTLPHELHNDENGINYFGKAEGSGRTNLPYQQFICVNTHLLFPHNDHSTNIRLREITKILGYASFFFKCAEYFL